MHDLPTVEDHIRGGFKHYSLWCRGCERSGQVALAEIKCEPGTPMAMLKFRCSKCGSNDIHAQLANNGTPQQRGGIYGSF